MVEMAQDLARRLRVEPAALDCLMVNPTSDELMRFKRLAGVSTPAMQSRFGIIKVFVGGRGCVHFSVVGSRSMTCPTIGFGQCFVSFIRGLSHCRVVHTYEHRLHCHNSDPSV